MNVLALGTLLPRPLQGHVSRLLGRGYHRWRGPLNRTGIAFIHIPKCAGTSVSEWLYGNQIGHLTWEQLRRIDRKGFDRWLKFAVAREPVERFLSAWHYLSRGGITDEDRRFSERIVAPAGDLCAFAARLADDPAFRREVLAYWHFRPQAAFVCDRAGRVMVNRLLPFERLSELPRLLGIDRPLPHRNVTPKPGDDIPKTTRKQVSALYPLDGVLYAFARAGWDETNGVQIVLTDDF